ncbi:hypothetical protein BD311DRAFT_649234 [Dichomitus squalens]|uniref:REJ domain-containing protein n=1 Tax=Dichomitus squalens TaxID=114155 RepID=A0A4V2K252_9APHY|nr:hypothetical protein BD311DRAFT_649234 [Dichomitus squalens]
MAGQSVSKGATPTGTSATVSASQGSTADATTKASATASPDTSSSQAAHTSQDPAPPVSPASATSSAATPSSSAVNSATASPSQTSTEKAATTTAGGDATRTSGSGSGTQIAIPSHTTNSETDALTTSVQGVSSTSSPSSTSQGDTQPSPGIPIPLPLPSNSATPSRTIPLSSASSVISPVALPSSTAALPFESTRNLEIPAPSSSTVPSSSQPVLTSLIQGTAVMGASGTPTSAAVEQSSSAPSAISATSLSNVNSSKGTSGVAQAPKQQAPNQNPAETTSTITDKSETTLSTPVFLTVTNAHNQTTLSEPPVFTSVGVTTSNGQVVSITHVIANPTGIWGVNAAESSHGFFSNSGAVAGVFLVVGIVIAALGVGICLFIRRRRRRNPRFIESISRPLPMPDNPFEDPRSLSPAPQMRYASGYTDRTLVIGGAGTPTPTPARSPFSSDVDHGSLTSSQTHTSGEPLSGLGLAGIGAGGGRRYSSGTQSSSGSRSRRSSQQGSIGLAITSDHARDASRSARRETSSAQSSPSIYPPSLPALPGEENRSMVNVPLSNNNSTAHLSTTSTNRMSSPTTRKPVPLHDLPEPIAPKPLSPMQREAQQTKPPVIPPRSPLRRNSTANSRSLSRSPPPPALASIQTQLKTPDLGNPYEPLTPPISFASLSPPGSSSGHEPPTPNTPAGANAAANPFSDIHAQQPTQVDIVTAFPMVRSGKRETFYTRTGGSQRRPSVEWRHRD